MSLCRVVVSVATASGGGWRVDVRLDGADVPLVDAFGINAAELPGTVSGQRIPVVPESRRRQADPLVDALCQGDTGQAAALIDRILLRDPGPDGDVVAYGRWLFECLLAPAWTAVTEIAAVRQARGVDLALQWAPEEADLHRLVWEAMHDGTDYLARNAALLVSVTRLVPVADADRPETITRLPRVLFAAGSSLADPVIRPGAMFMGLLRAFEAEGHCVPSAIQEASIDKLADECARFQPDLVHLVAHGAVRDRGRRVLVLGKPGADADADALVQALTVGGRPLAVAISACQSGSPGGLESAVPLATALMTKANIPIVAAMTGEVSEQACRLYTRRFVEAIHDGESIVEASAKGRRAALQNAANSADYIDWALPALFLASSVPPGFCPVDPRPGRELMRIARGLELPSRPVFIGSQEILRMADDELIHPDPDKGIGFVAITSKDITKLGGTRLLREIGFRLLRRGHLPLLLAPYSENTAPKSLRAVVSEILDKLLAALVQLRQPPFPLTVLAADPGFTAPQAGASTIDLQDAVLAFKRGSEELEPDRVRWRLANDLAALARAAAAAGQPFGEHTRVVVLGDEFHYWVKGLDGILEVLKNKVDSGLGTADCPVPLIVTGSLSIAGGPKLKAFTDEHSAMVRVPPLDALPLPDAVLGFEWVLLHPLLGDPEPAKRIVYTRARKANAEKVENDFKLLRGLPTAVASELYFLVQMLVNHDQFVSGDDDKAWDAYVGRYG
jgi:CHAT domain